MSSASLTKAAPAVETSKLRQLGQLRQEESAICCVKLRHKEARSFSLTLKKKFLSVRIVSKRVSLFRRNSECFYLSWKTLVVKKSDWI